MCGSPPPLQLDNPAAGRHTFGPPPPPPFPALTHPRPAADGCHDHLTERPLGLFSSAPGCSRAAVGCSHVLCSGGGRRRFSRFSHSAGSTRSRVQRSRQTRRRGPCGAASAPVRHRLWVGWRRRSLRARFYHCLRRLIADGPRAGEPAAAAEEPASALRHLMLVIPCSITLGLGCWQVFRLDWKRREVRSPLP